LYTWSEKRIKVRFWMALIFTKKINFPFFVVWFGFSFQPCVGNIKW
jgi:hypothetical protein